MFEPCGSTQCELNVIIYEDVRQKEARQKQLLDRPALESRGKIWSSSPALAIHQVLGQTEFRSENKTKKLKEPASSESSAEMGVAVGAVCHG